MNLLDDVRAERAKYPTPLDNPDMGAILNAVAWKNRAEGWGMARKETGARTVQPLTGIPISRDLLVHAPTQQMWDVLRDVGNAAEPVWGNPVVQDLPFVEPVQPELDDDETPPSANLARIRALVRLLMKEVGVKEERNGSTDND